MSDSPTTGPAIVDTNVFGARMVPTDKSKLGVVYARHLSGRRLIIAYQTVAELRYWALKGGWGDKKLDQLEQSLRRAAIARMDGPLAQAYARLKDRYVRAGHALGQKEHDGDRWIAATAIRYQIPLISHDGVFYEAPGLELITELGRDA
ncbi:MAG: PIN domain-containing protein [Egibacteraceae bacterium]